MALRSLLSSSLIKTVKCGDFIKVGDVCFNSVRNRKHWKPEYKRLRTAKVIKMKLPEFEESTKRPEDYTEEEIRSKFKERGVLPTYPHIERPMYISSTGDIFEPYIPPEGDGKVSIIKKEGAKQTLRFMEKKGKSMLAIRKVRSFDDDFEIADFLPVAQDIYIKAHEAMAAKDKDLLQQYVTERAYPEALHNIERKTMHWKFIQSLEPPYVCHARCTDIITKDNIFGQITVRFHTQQVLAVYDRFGRLMYGSEILAKDVLEYVVFERHLSNRYGMWRIHAKIIPDWMPPREPGITTYRIERSPPPEPVSESPVKTEPEKIQEVSTSTPTSNPPPLATA